MNIKEYSALAVSILLFQKETDAQIIYTDIPDASVSSNSPLFIDLNNDGVFELKLKKEVYFYYDSGSGPWYTNFWQFDLYAIPENNNAVVGNGDDWVQALNLGIPINDNSPWLTDDSFKMGYWGMSIGDYGDGGQWTWTSIWGSGEWAGNGNDRYLGVQFVHGVDTLYGWVRIFIEDVAYFGATVKDYAYQKTPNTSIQAGENFAVGSPEVKEQDLVVHSLPNKTIELFLNTPEFIGGKITILNILGQLIETSYLDKSVKRIVLQNSPAGLYAISVTKNGKQLNKTIVLH